MLSCNHIGEFCGSVEVANQSSAFTHRFTVYYCSTGVSRLFVARTALTVNAIPAGATCKETPHLLSFMGNFITLLLSIFEDKVCRSCRYVGRTTLPSYTGGPRGSQNPGGLIQ